uniref:Uncharacterized protein n=1 Tax=Romanomermis culicivorax TaxID=13658 RepID=A0A915JJD5_ROMCU
MFTQVYAHPMLRPESGSEFPAHQTRKFSLKARTRPDPKSGFNFEIRPGPIKKIRPEAQPEMVLLAERYLGIELMHSYRTDNNCIRRGHLENILTSEQLSQNVRTPMAPEMIHKSDSNFMIIWWTLVATEILKKILWHHGNVPK